MTSKGNMSLLAALFLAGGMMAAVAQTQPQPQTQTQQGAAPGARSGAQTGCVDQKTGEVRGGSATTGSATSPTSPPGASGANTTTSRMPPC
jgi:hypothetical protein